MPVTTVDPRFPSHSPAHLEEAVFQTIAHDLATQGYVVLDHPLPGDLLASLLQRITELSWHEFKPAGIGRQDDYRLSANTRRDRIHWLSGPDKDTAAYFEWIEALRLAINKELFLGLFDYECHFAWYPPGGYYKKHVDAFRGESNRRLSTILYLNANWSPGDGGELAMYHEDDREPFLVIQPEFGRMVIFLSEEFPHEVLEAHQPRFSLSGWYRINASTSNIPDPPLLT